MLRWFCLLTCLYLTFSASLAFADSVTLRSRVESNGPQITLGDVFEGADAVASRPIGPSPAPGQISTISVQLLSAVASAAGLEWTPPLGIDQVQVVHPGGARALLPPPSGTVNGRSIGGDVAIHRGEPVTLVYEAPGIQLSMRTRALEDGAVGQGVRLLNTVSNRTIDAVVTGPGAARANP